MQTAENCPQCSFIRADSFRAVVCVVQPKADHSQIGSVTDHVPFQSPQAILCGVAADPGVDNVDRNAWIQNGQDLLQVLVVDMHLIKKCTKRSVRAPVKRKAALCDAVAKKGKRHAAYRFIIGCLVF